MSGPAISSDLTDSSLRALTTIELSVGTRKLTTAWNMILSKIPTAAVRITTDEVFLQNVIDVQVDAVLRFLNNPDGKLEESGDDYSFRRDANTSTGAVFISDSEFALLGDGDSISEGAFTVKPAGTRLNGGFC
jgi:hypothetical protein